MCADLAAREESTVTAFDEFQEANQRYTADFDRENLPMLSARGVAVVSCMDARLHPEKFLGSRLGMRT